MIWLASIRSVNAQECNFLLKGQSCKRNSTTLSHRTRVEQYSYFEQNESLDQYINEQQLYSGEIHTAEHSNGSTRYSLHARAHFSRRPTELYPYDIPAGFSHCVAPVRSL